MKRIDRILWIMIPAMLLLTACVKEPRTEVTQSENPGPQIISETPVSSEPESNVIETKEEKDMNAPTLLYQGHASARIETAGGKVIYIDPFAGDGKHQSLIWNNK